MKSVFVVMTGSYNKRPAMVCQNRDEAFHIAASLNDVESSEDLENYVITLPYMCNPDTYDINDIVMTAIVSTKKVYEDMISQMSVPQNQQFDEQFE